MICMLRVRRFDPCIHVLPNLPRDHSPGEQMETETSSQTVCPSFVQPSGRHKTIWAGVTGPHVTLQTLISVCGR